MSVARPWKQALRRRARGTAALRRLAQPAPHLHAIFIDGVFDEAARFEPTPRPSATDLARVAERIAKRTERWLTRQGYTFDPSAHDRTPDFAEQAAQTSVGLAYRSRTRSPRRCASRLPPWSRRRPRAAGLRS